MNACGRDLHLKFVGYGLRVAAVWFVSAAIQLSPKRDTRLVVADFRTCASSLFADNPDE